MDKNSFFQQLQLQMKCTGVILRAFGGKINPGTSVGGLLYKSWKHKVSVRTDWARLLVFLLTLKTAGFTNHMKKNIIRICRK